MKKHATILFVAALAAGAALYVVPLRAGVGQGQQAQAAPQPAPPVVSVPGSTPAANPGVQAQDAVPVTEVKSPAAPAHYADQAIWALMISLLIQWLKKSPWFGWITPQSASRLKAQFGFLAAFLTAAGVHFAVSGSVLDGGGASITVTGLSINAFKDVAWQWASQQAWYQGVVKDHSTTIEVKP